MLLGQGVQSARSKILPFEVMSDEYLLLAQVREAFGRVVYSHKTHEKHADLCFGKHRRQRAALVVFKEIGTGTFPAALRGTFVSPQIAGLVTSLIALVVTALTLATKSFKFGDESEGTATSPRACGTCASRTYR